MFCKCAEANGERVSDVEGQANDKGRTSSSRCPHVRNARFPNRCGVGNGGISSIHASRISSICMVLSTA